MKYRKKLIEVSIPLDAINTASIQEKQPFTRKHPRSFHIWWARRPLAAARAVIFAQMVDDPSTYVDEILADPEIRTKAEAELERRRKVWQEQVRVYNDAERLGDASAPEPGPEPTLEECAAEIEREHLFRLIEKLVQWENTTNEEVLVS